MSDFSMLDSSVWIAYLCNGTYADRIDTETMFLLSTLSLFEIKRKLQREKFPAQRITQSMAFIKKRSLVIPVTAEIADHAVELSRVHNLPAMDALIFSTAVCSEAPLITLDNDFRGLPNVVVLPV